MATKRMFDKAIVDTDRFMDMQMSAKALYFLLGMEADDEGFVSYKKVMRVHGGNEDDLKVLAVKEFVIVFPSGVVVITDWNKNNWLDSRRIKPTEYQKEKNLIALTSDNRYLLSNRLASIEERRGEENNSREESLETLSFEGWMQDQGYTHDSIVDESGNVHEVWLQDERPVKKSQVTAMRKKYDAQFKAPVQHRSTSFDDTDRLVEIIQKVVKEQYGSSPVLTRKEKEMIRRNIVEKFDKEFVKGYAQWYFQDSDLEKKWRFQIPSFTSTSFINQYLAQQD
jgi:hypothetical protein